MKRKDTVIHTSVLAAILLEQREGEIRLVTINSSPLFILLVLEIHCITGCCVTNDLTILTLHITSSVFYFKWLSSGTIVAF